MRTSAWVMALGVALANPPSAWSGPCTFPGSPDTVTFYVVAHPDDWQLFMNPNAYNDAARRSEVCERCADNCKDKEGNEDCTSACRAKECGGTVKVVFVYLLAGDGGSGAGPNPKVSIADNTYPFYLAREDAAKESMQFIADADPHPRPPCPAFSALTVVNGHSINRFQYRNVAGYFLRLPDGGPDGKGHATTGSQSLANVLKGGTIASVDNKERYSLGDLVKTIATIADRERDDADIGWFNRHETNPNLSSPARREDHSDHVSAGELARRAARNVDRCVNQASFLGYQTNGKTPSDSDLPPNLSGEAIEVEAGTFAVVARALNARGYTGTWDQLHRSYLERRYVTSRTCCAGDPCQAGVAVP